jgi:CMP-N-acetylneuraminic acid synthetase
LSIADKAGAHVIKRDPYYATNSISINEVYKNLAESVFPHEHVLFAHLTSPLVKFESLRECLEIYKKMQVQNKYDSLATVTNVHKFMWYKNKAINYNPENMPRSQDLPDYYVLNFAFNILKRDLMIERKNIIGKSFYPYHLDELQAYDIDTEIEFKIAEYIYKEINE